MAKVPSRHDQGRGSFFLGRRRARQTSMASTEYSATWLPLRTAAWMARMVSSEMFGLSQRSSGPMMREVRCEDNRSVEPVKIRPIQRTTRDQYLNHKPVPDTAGSTRGAAAESSASSDSFYSIC